MLAPAHLLRRGQGQICAQCQFDLCCQRLGRLLEFCHLGRLLDAAPTVQRMLIPLKAARAQEPVYTPVHWHSRERVNEVSAYAHMQESIFVSPTKAACVKDAVLLLFELLGFVRRWFVRARQSHEKDRLRSASAGLPQTPAPI